MDIVFKNVKEIKLSWVELNGVVVLFLLCRLFKKFDKVLVSLELILCYGYV